MNEFRNVVPQTVEFDVLLENGTRVGSMVTCSLPNAGDLIRVDDPQKQPLYSVVRRYFEPNNITVYVTPYAGSAQQKSEFSRQAPGAGGFS